MTEYLRAPEVARRLGLRTSTLARYRRDGTGPAGWVRLNEVTVVYPIAEVERWIEQRRAATAVTTFPRRATA